MYVIIRPSPFAPPSLLLCSCFRINMQSNKSSIILAAEFLSMWNWDVGNFSSPSAIASSNKKPPAKTHSPALLSKQVFWQKLLGAAVKDLSRQTADAPPTTPSPSPPSLPPVDTCSLWHLDRLPYCQWSRGQWMMCCMHCLVFIAPTWHVRNNSKCVLYIIVYVLISSEELGKVGVFTVCG